MKKYNPLTTEFVLKNKKLLLTEDRNIDGYIPKAYCELKKDNTIIPSNHHNFSHILKFSLGVPSGAENEHFFLWLSKHCKINTSNSFLIKEEVEIDNINYNSFMLLSENFILPHQNIVHLKSIFQTEERKKGITLDRIYQVIDNFEETNNINRENIKLELFKQVLFSNTIGNYDLNYGNIAFLTNEYNEIINLAPAYDITCTYAFDDSTKSSIVINGKRKNVQAVDILNVSSKYLNRDILFSSAKNILFGLRDNFSEIQNSYMDKEDIVFVFDYIKERIEILYSSLTEFAIQNIKKYSPEQKILTLDEFNLKLSDKLKNMEELKSKYIDFLELELIDAQKNKIIEDTIDAQNNNDMFLRT